MNRCLYCYKELSLTEVDFHATCSKKMFGSKYPPVLSYAKDEMDDLALLVVRSQMAVTGVQPKLSLTLTHEKGKADMKRFTIVGVWGTFILKPPTSHYHQLPETEDLTMHLAQIAKIQTVPHSLIRLQSGELCYITKRIDRGKYKKLHMEDMCQLTGKMTEDKYHGSYEQIAKTIRKYSANPGLDVVNFFEQVLFSFLTGNADMHLKNFSLLHQSTNGYTLSPAYDMVSTALVNPADDEDLALTLNGKKKKMKMQDFISAFNTLDLDSKQQENIIMKMKTAYPKWLHLIEISFLDKEYREQFTSLIAERFRRLGL